MCSQSFPDGEPPLCSGLTLPPNVFCLWPRLPPVSFRQPPPVIRHVDCGQVSSCVQGSLLHPVALSVTTSVYVPLALTLMHCVLAVNPPGPLQS